MKGSLLSSKCMAAAIGILFLVSGCATSDRPWATQSPIAPEIQLPENSPLRGAFQAGAVTLAATLGKSFFCSGIFDNWTQQTRRSLEQFLRADRLLAENNPRYDINLRLMSADTSTSLNADKTTVTNIQFEIIETKNQRIVVRDAVNTTYVAKAGDTFDGCARERLSALGSTNDGIRTILNKAASLQ